MYKLLGVEVESSTHYRDSRQVFICAAAVAAARTTQGPRTPTQGINFPKGGSNAWLGVQGAPHLVPSGPGVPSCMKIINQSQSVELLKTKKTVMVAGSWG